MGASSFLERAFPLRPELPADERRRARKLVSLALLVAAVGLLSAVLHLSGGDERRAGWTSLVVLDAFVALLALRSRVPLTWVASGFIGAALALVAVPAMETGADGVSAVFWMSAAPLIALAVGGRRAGWLTLGLTVAVITVVLVGIERGWLFAHEPPRPFPVRLLSMVAVVLVLFFIALAYERETAVSISALEAQNRALAEARAEADRASRAKTDFLSTISHEIRTPLNGVTGMITLLANERDPVRIRDGLRVAQQSADTLLAVISDVLDISKVEANRLELEAVPVSLRDELRLVVELMQPRAEENGNDLELTVGAEVPAWVRGDSTRLRQVVLNLVSNAIKFTSKGRVSCRLGGGSGQLVLEVSDTGVGMEPSTLERLFTPFSQSDASTTRRFGGTGLGLFIAHRLVSAMGGAIAVTSRVGVGTTFSVRLPLEATEAPLEARVVAASAPASMRILLVEDNAINQLVARRLIEQLGHQVTVVADGKQALSACEASSYDLVLMDCHMPEMDGFEATRRLRERGDPTPIVALSAAVSLDDRLRCFEVGMNATLSKPLRFEQLKALIDGLSATRSRAA
ncbi:MAG: ATP-binding protein [Myxococcales bacterium]|nr:ATP-binding protein [Myxococcales bacterium]